MATDPYSNWDQWKQYVPGGAGATLQDYDFSAVDPVRLSGGYYRWYKSNVGDADRTTKGDWYDNYFRPATQGNYDFNQYLPQTEEGLPTETYNPDTNYFPEPEEEYDPLYDPFATAEALGDPGEGMVWDWDPSQGMNVPILDTTGLQNAEDSNEPEVISTGTITREDISDELKSKIPGAVTAEDLASFEVVWDEERGMWREPGLGERPSALVGFDANGNPTVLQDYTFFYDMLDELAAMDPRSIEEFMAANGMSYQDIPDMPAMPGEDPRLTDVLGKIEGLGGTAAAGPTDEDMASANAEAAALYGMTPEEYDATINASSQRIGANDLSVYGGMGEEALALEDRKLRSEMRSKERQYQRLIESVGAASNSATRMLATADEAMRNLYDYELQRKSAIMQQNIEVQLEQFKADRDMLAQMVESKRLTIDEFFDRVRTERDAALQAYQEEADILRAQQDAEIDAILQAYDYNLQAAYDANQQIFDAYEQDRQYFEDMRAATINAFDLESGMHDIVSGDQQAYFDTVMATFNSRLESLTGLQSLDELLADPALVEELGPWAELLATIVGIFFKPGG